MRKNLDGTDLHDFSAGAPGEVMATDIAEFRLPGDSRRGHSPDDAACEGFFGGLKV